MSEFSIGPSAGVVGGPSELSECVREGLPAEECGTPALQVGAADEHSVRSRRHGGNCIGGGSRSVSYDVGHSGHIGRTGVHGVNEAARGTGRQVGGNHYKDFAIQPTEYIVANDLGWCEANIVKYISRHASKGGAEDVRKAIHYAELLLELKYGENCEDSIHTRR